MPTLRAKSFEFGIPMPIAIKKAGENVEGKFGDQVAFATSGGTLYLDPEPASGIEIDMRKQGIRYGEEFLLTRAQTGGFIVRRLGDGGGNNNGRSTASAAFAPATPAAIAPPAQLINNAHYNPPAPEAPAVATAPEGMTAATQCLMSAMCSAIDAAIETQAYAARKGLGVTFSEESIRAMGLSIYISACKGGR